MWTGVRLCAESRDVYCRYTPWKPTAPEEGTDDETLGADAVQPGAEHTIEREPLDELIAGTLTVVDVLAIVTYFPA